jgi:hypothetical protein
MKYLPEIAGKSKTSSRRRCFSKQEVYIMFNKKLAFILAGFIFVFPVFGQSLTTKALTEKVSSDKTLKKQTSSDDDGKFELGAHFSSLSADFDGDRTGLGVTLGYRFAKFGDGKFTATAEAEFNFLPGRVFTGDVRKSGRVKQGLFGLKVGRKFEKFGVFAKLRPGFINYSNGTPEPATLINTATGSGTFSISGFGFSRQTKGKTNFATDIGGVVEFYPTKKVFTRFDFGDTVVRLRSTVLEFPVFTTTGGTTTTIIQRIPIPASTQHNFQFSAGIGFRF